MSRFDVMNYDPNLCLCGRMAEQIVRLTFGAWKARLTMDVKVGGNCLGLSVIQQALNNAFSAITEKDNIATLTLIYPNGDTLIVEDDEDREESWLEDLLIGAEIISIAAK